MDNNKTTNRLTLAFFLNLLFAIIELIGGILTNSTAIIADAFHDFMDAIAIGAAVFIEKYSKKPPTNTFTYGYRRFNLLSAMVMSVILLVGASGMIYQAIINFSTTKEVHSLGMLLLAILGILVNGFAFLKIKQGNNTDHNHSHAHSHTHTNNANSKAIMLHLLEDVLGWIAVLIGSAIMYFTNWFWIDSFLTVAIALFISYNAIKNLYSVFLVLLQKAPTSINVQMIKDAILKLDSNAIIVALNVWTIDGENHVATIKLALKATDLDHINVLKNQIKNIFSDNNINNLTIDIDTAL